MTQFRTGELGQCVALRRRLFPKESKKDDYLEGGIGGLDTRPGKVASPLFLRWGGLYLIT